MRLLGQTSEAWSGTEVAPSRIIECLGDRSCASCSMSCRADPRHLLVLLLRYYSSEISQSEPFCPPLRQISTLVGVIDLKVLQTNLLLPSLSNQEGSFCPTLRCLRTRPRSLQKAAISWWASSDRFRARLLVLCDFVIAEIGFSVSSSPSGNHQQRQDSDWAWYRSNQ